MRDWSDLIWSEALLIWAINNDSFSLKASVSLNAMANLSSSASVIALLAGGGVGVGIGVGTGSGGLTTTGLLSLPSKKLGGF